MNENNAIKALEWYEKGEHDLEAVKILIEKGGPSDVAGVLLQQAVEKYLKGYLVSKGWRLRKIHDLKVLLDEAIKHDASFSQYYDISDILTQYYLEEKYPFGKTIEVPLGDIEEAFGVVCRLIEKIKK